jgi:hypothetical protein
MPEIIQGARPATGHNVRGIVIHRRKVMAGWVTRAVTTLMFGISLAIASTATAADPAALAMRANEVNQEYCADIYGAEVQLAIEGYRHVTGIWGEIDDALDVQPDPVLMYWRGVLAHCLGQPDRALEDLRPFIEGLDDDSRATLQGLADDAEMRIRRIESLQGQASTALTAKDDWNQLWDPAAAEQRPQQLEQFIDRYEPLASGERMPRLKMARRARRMCDREGPFLGALATGWLGWNNGFALYGGEALALLVLPMRDPRQPSRRDSALMVALGGNAGHLWWSGTERRYVGEDYIGWLDHDLDVYGSLVIGFGQFLAGSTRHGHRMGITLLQALDVAFGERREKVSCFEEFVATGVCTEEDDTWPAVDPALDLRAAFAFHFRSGLRLEAGARLLVPAYGRTVTTDEPLLSVGPTVSIGYVDFPP